MARKIMYEGGNHPQPINCAQCKADPRPRNCGGFCPGGKKDCPGSTGGWPKLPNGCCNLDAAKSCDGEVIPTPDKDRGKDYNHSTYLDIIISGLVGLRAAFGNIFTVNPLADSTIKYFALDNVAYHGHNLTIAYDSTGLRYSARGCSGLCVWVDGNIAAQSPTLSRLNISLPAQTKA